MMRTQDIRFRRLQLVAGFTLIELMVAIVLGIIVSGGIISLFASTSRANRSQMSLARMQEQGRYAVATLTEDLRMVNAQYCSSTGGLASATSTGYMVQDRLRSPTIFVRPLSLPDSTTPFATAPTEPYPLPSRFYMRGYECNATTCTPTAPTSIPAMGVTAGDRIIGTDVLTVRKLDAARGWSLGAGYSNQTCGATGKILSINMVQGPSEPPITAFTGNVAMVADCSQSQVFAATGAGTATLGVATSGNFAGSTPKCSLGTDARLFDFSTDFTTTTYYLELRADDNPDAPAGHLVGALMRQVNGGPAEEIVRGVERLDFRYGVENADGATAYLTADQVDVVNRSGAGTFDCPPGPPHSLHERNPTAYTGTGCMWRAIKSIEVSMLLNSVNRMNMADAELEYVYAPAGSATQAPPASVTNVRGLSSDLMRRSFTNVVSIRNYNP